MLQNLHEYIGQLVLVGLGFLALQVIAQSVGYVFKKKLNAKNNNPNSKVLDSKLDTICKKLDSISQDIKQTNQTLAQLRVDIAKKK